MLEGRQISYVRGFTPLFSGISFSLGESEILAVKGANGSGKTTLLRLVTGLIRPPAGALYWWEGLLTSHNIKEFQQHLLYVGHKLALHLDARVKDQIQLWEGLYQVPRKDIEKALRIWDIAHLKDKKISYLSQGQQKRLSLSLCSWLKRPLWILDEPQAGLDQDGKDLLFQFLSQHLDRKGSAIIATHESLPGEKELNL